MSRHSLFSIRPDVHPTIYAYKLQNVADHEGFLKVGYTDRDVRTRVNEQTHTAGLKAKIVLRESAVRANGTSFRDTDVHRILRNMGCQNLAEGKEHNEWYRCTTTDIRNAILTLRTGKKLDTTRSKSFPMRPEQQDAVQKTKAYFLKERETNPTGEPPKFLWNAKMRFGKTFATYQLAKTMNFKRILVLTFKPAVESAWAEDLAEHIDFEGWQFVSNKDAKAKETTSLDEEFKTADPTKPIVVFGSFQDLLGTNENGGIKAKNEFIHTENWDLVVFDEYHYGAWRDNAKKLFSVDDEEEASDFDPELYRQHEAGNAFNESFLPITTDFYLYLSGTPFRALNSGEFIEDQIFNWTYGDEQQAKESWQGENNPYASLPQMVMLTYRLPGSICQLADQGEFDEFDLNVFFSAEGHGKEAKFKYENEVQKWLDLIRGNYLPAEADYLKLGQDKRPPMPYNDVRLLESLQHTLWYLPNVASCEAMANLLARRHNVFFHDYQVIVCAGTKAGIGLAALEPVYKAMKDPLETKTITLSCGKLNTGVTVRPWSGVFMLRNLKSPETYFQTAFRAQSPWTTQDDDGNEIILKEVCYVIDFALERALRQISDYSRQMDIKEPNPEKKVEEFIKFLPVLAFDKSAMRQVNAQEILDIAMSGTSATLLARRWESALLVNVDNDTLRRLLASKEAMKALLNIEGFRSLNHDIETIINKSDHVKKLKKQQNKLPPEEKSGLSQEEKEYKKQRKFIQEKLIKFATRIPVFMYLSEFRERSLKDVITQLEPDLFVKVTGLTHHDFELLCTLGVFNASLMDDAVYKFKRYEDASLEYTGINKHANEDIGGFETTLNRQEYERLYYNQSPETSGRESIETFTQTADFKAPQRPDNKSTSNSKKLDVSLLKVGNYVKNKSFGRGKIIKLKKNKLTVQFSGGTKKYTIPDAFEQGFLEI